MKHDVMTVNVSRGGVVESKHSIKAVIIDSAGTVIESWGDVETPVYPRSAIKALQALAFVELGGTERFGFSEEDIAICCASHNGEVSHVNVVEGMLSKIEATVEDFECGCHWPMHADTSYKLAATGEVPTPLHNNCSGKHAGMLAFAKMLGVETQGYTQIDHEVQKRIASTMAEMCEYDYSNAPWSPDGCSAPTWAIPLTNLGLAFAKFADPSNLPPERKKACETLYNAVTEMPFIVAGTERYCTDMMHILDKDAFLKVGAEGVYIAAIPKLKLAIALKCEDGAVRAAESVMTALLDYVGITEGVPDGLLQPYRSVALVNRKGLITGAIECDLDSK